MNTKLLMAASALLMGFTGIALSFMPTEILNSAGADPDKSVTLILQVCGALYLGFAMMNWMAKVNLMGGIYSKPLAMGNFIHFVIGGIALAKGSFANSSLKIILIPAVFYCIFAVLFGIVVFGSPVKKPG